MELSYCFSQSQTPAERGMMNSNTQEGGGRGGHAFGAVEAKMKEGMGTVLVDAPLHCTCNITYTVTCFLPAAKPAGHHSRSPELSGWLFQAQACMQAYEIQQAKANMKFYSFHM